MSQLSKTNFATAQDSRFDDILPSRATTRKDIRDLATDMKDSALFITDNFIDEDSFASNSDTKVPSQQSVKAYVDAGKIYRVKVNISSAEILALNATPKQLVAAPGVNKMIEVLKIHQFYTFVTAAYAGTTTLTYAYDTGSGVVAATGPGLINQSANMVQIANTNNISSGSKTISDVTNKSLVVTANPTTGSGTLVVYVTYVITDV